MKNKFFWFSIFINFYFFLYTFTYLGFEVPLSRFIFPYYKLIIHAYDYSTDGIVLADIDGDGRNDIVEYIGCVQFASKISKEGSQDSRCRTGYAFSKKIIDTFEPKRNDERYPIEIAYAVRDNDRNWQIMVSEKSGDKYVVKENAAGEIIFDSDIPFIFWADIWLYTFAKVMWVLGLPWFLVIGILIIVPLNLIVGQSFPGFLSSDWVVFLIFPIIQIALATWSYSLYIPFRSQQSNQKES